jgi:hypothetical protein
MMFKYRCRVKSPDDFLSALEKGERKPLFLPKGESLGL